MVSMPLMSLNDRRRQNRIGFHSFPDSSFQGLWGRDDHDVGWDGGVEGLAVLADGDC